MTEKYSLKQVKFKVVNSGIKVKDLDLLLVVFDDLVNVSGAFTTSNIVSPSIDWDREVLAKNKKIKALVVNSGNANCFTGSLGKKAIIEITSFLAGKLNVEPDQILVSSTGVIGQKLPYEKIINALPKMLEEASEGDLTEAARAIMTTDTKPKIVEGQADIDGQKVKIIGIAKGAGMAGPNLATVLSYFFTDANISNQKLKEITTSLIEDSFNSFTIDGDMSTNDTFLIFANGAAGNKKSDDLTGFKKVLKELMIEICDKIVEDGEGVTKMMKINLIGASSKKEAKKAAIEIANSPLVKTALNGADPNWGRIAMAVGKSKVAINLDSFQIDIGGFNIVKNGELNPDYDEAKTTAPYMKNNKLIEIKVDLGVSKDQSNSALITSCDFSKGYIEINADYRS